MNDKLMREECSDCQKLIREYTEDNLSICVRCGHYFYGAECDCGDGHSTRRKSGGIKNG